MNLKNANLNSRALVSVFDDLETATSVVENLIRQGFPRQMVELVTRAVRNDFPEMESSHETTSSVLASGAVKGAGIGLGIGAGFGVAAAALTASPALAVGAMLYAGFAGGLVGGMGGVDQADLDDSINLPTHDEYQHLLDGGNSLVVVCGTHEEVQRAESIVKDMPNAVSHQQRLHGHLFHEHPSHL